MSWELRELSESKEKCYSVRVCVVCVNEYVCVFWMVQWCKFRMANRGAGQKIKSHSQKFIRSHNKIQLNMSEVCECVSLRFFNSFAWFVCCFFLCRTVSIHLISSVQYSSSMTLNCLIGVCKCIHVSVCENFTSMRACVHHIYTIIIIFFATSFVLSEKKKKIIFKTREWYVVELNWMQPFVLGQLPDYNWIN